MFTEERRSFIIDFLRKKGKVTVSELTKQLKVSSVTIRKDLDFLEANGILVRTHGGAILPDHSRSEWNFLKKIHQRENEKKRIAKKIISLIEDGDTVILDSSSTNYYATFELRKADLSMVTIVTNNVFIAGKLIELGIEVLVLGGVVRENSLSLVGPWAVRFLEEINVDKAFLGTTGFSVEKGFMTPSVVEADVKKAMIRSASKVYIVTDSTKFARNAFASFALPEDIDGIITDEEIPREYEAFLLEKGIKVYKV
ncbi:MULTISPECIES: DeoR/GlpR family DNA-binding transcription regulator [Pseudothermotoga]|uniref:Transcriptional regulator, DeoR family n=1 Tax=Pseudothermotoga lettingae (strain ATCC BAA-301 / DSM 14385 / NBRC 107922 / TMO) TaxID=416591 RepID=A8F5F8_PSELT|nr:MULTISPECIES: DeoR/GlpR family DNA-binding transcription regulator [Pseudothermotoga]ABV33392.1 transcriptional regulator, DeoR family [Pseudothermotoga lettingae TMO]KUK19998.1 MAG: Transcriptional regulator, DeoR family [Pseudothermotoga lettingae]MDI3495531.1 DeoR family transcriptional regulator, fructose operon transcriptional repressor [Pseudothermotoga sp.]MDK2884438.1 DeoR family transcriptional regulator, fructose operon transcriptional repressor [Pseudothermotoga sp.]GLI49694.1 De